MNQNDDQQFRYFCEHSRNRSSEESRQTHRKWEEYKFARQDEVFGTKSKASQAKHPKGGSKLSSQDSASWNRKDSWTFFTAPAIDLRGTEFTGVRAKYIDLRGALLDEATFNSPNHAQCNLQGANLEYASLRRAKMKNIQLVDADLRDADLTGAKLQKADLSGAKLQKADLSGAKLQKADLSGANLAGANISGANLAGANISGANLVGAILAGCCLDGAYVHGVAVWDIFTDEKTSQKNLIITKDVSEVIVDDIEVAQFIYLLLNREKLRNVLTTVTNKGVLILGRFNDGGLKVLRAIADKVREMGYLPLLFDFEQSENRDFTETVKVMVGLSRFVIVDLSGPSVLKELEATVKNFEVPFIPIIEEGRSEPSMTRDLDKYQWFHYPAVNFASKEKLIEMLPKTVIARAEKIGKKIEKRRARLYPENGK